MSVHSSGNTEHMDCKFHFERLSADTIRLRSELTPMSQAPPTDEEFYGAWYLGAWNESFYEKPHGRKRTVGLNPE